MQAASPAPLSAQEASEAREAGERLLDGLNALILGQQVLTRQVVVAALAEGHVLLQGLPGLGKTEMVKGLARLLGLKFRRVQFTPDLLPGDITGGHVLQETAQGRDFVFRPGPVFTQVLLADEINRASPKTQSALLEAMAERRVTVLGETRELPRPFFVLATQNPIEMEGTYPLPEAQLDRFLFRVEVPGIGAETMQRIILERRHGQPPEPAPVADEKTLLRFQGCAGRLHFPRAVAGWVARLCAASHPDAPGAHDLVRRCVRYGASPRAAIAIAEAARAEALLGGKTTVGFDDVRRVALPALNHRLILDYRARLDGVTPRAVVEALLAAVPELGEPAPAEVRDAAR